MITIHFSRAESFARFSMPSQVADFFARGLDAYLDLCRTMTDAGWPDEPVEFVDERGMRCLEGRSLHGVARRYRPNADDLAQRKAKKATASATTP